MQRVQPSWSMQIPSLKTFWNFSPRSAAMVRSSREEVAVRGGQTRWLVDFGWVQICIPWRQTLPLWTCVLKCCPSGRGLLLSAPTPADLTHLVFVARLLTLTCYCKKFWVPRSRSSQVISELLVGHYRVTFLVDSQLGGPVLLCYLLICRGHVMDGLSGSICVSQWAAFQNRAHLSFHSEAHLFIRSPPFHHAVKKGHPPYSAATMSSQTRLSHKV